MKTFVNDVPQTILSDEIYQHADGVSLFVGVVNVEKDTFFPFYGVGSCYDSGFVFPAEDSMRIVDAAEELWPDKRPIQDIQEEFTRHQADYPAAVTNNRLFERIAKMALIRESRRVQWAGDPADGEAQGTVMKIDDQEMHILWDDHKGSRLPLFDYALTDEHIQPA